MKTIIITAKSCLDYYSPGHPESPERVEKTVKYLADRGHIFITPVPATKEDIFLGKDRVLYISLHQNPCYPGTGGKPEKNVRNYPLPAGTDGRTYFRAFDRALAEAVSFEPDILAVSAGFDAYRGDPLTSMGLSTADFFTLGKKIKTLGKKVFSILEGGYSPDLPELVFSYLSAFE